MTEAKPFASLSSTLLARKGSARPAMRPQIQLTSRPVKFALSARCAPHEDDLGWNDMGYDLSALKADRLSIGAAFAPKSAPPKSATGPAVVIPLAKAAKRKVAPLPVAEPVAAGKPQTARRSRRKALTLRVEQDRHLQLRLACTVQNRTAQSVLSEALDRLLEDIPGVRELAARIRQDG
jgi:hypothetical protein